MTSYCENSLSTDEKFQKPSTLVACVSLTMRITPACLLGASLRALSSLCEDVEAQVQPPVSGGEWADFAFCLNGLKIPLHRCILSARSPYFRQMLRTVWQPEARSNFASAQCQRIHIVGFHFRSKGASFCQSQLPSSSKGSCIYIYLQAKSLLSSTTAIVAVDVKKAEHVQKGRARQVVLQHVLHNAQPSALKSLLVWFYTERLEMSISDVDAVKRLAKRCGLKMLVKALVEEQGTLKFSYKTIRREEQPRR